MTDIKGKIGVLIEDHFDPSEYRRFNEYFPTQGYEVEYISHLWGQPELHFGSNPEDNVVEERVTVTTEVNDIDPADYAGIILIGAYATDRLRYQVKIKKGQKNQAPAVVFLRKAMAQQAKVGTICHSMWLLCADSDLLKGRQVTCAHNIVCDVENAGGEVIYTEDDETVDLVIDGNLISGKHPGMVDQFMEAFVQEIENN
jgi:putative intracellular protease/amidase